MTKANGMTRSLVLAGVVAAVAPALVHAADEPAPAAAATAPAPTGRNIGYVLLKGRSRLPAATYMQAGAMKLVAAIIKVFKLDEVVAGTVRGCRVQTRRLENHLGDSSWT
jgi:hypothetical protein